MKAVAGAIDRLLLAYEEERNLYRELRDLANKTMTAARSGEPISAIHQLAGEKRRLLQAIDRIEARHRQEKAEWSAGLRSSEAAGRLSGLLEEIANLIEETLTVERESDQFIVREATLSAGRLA